MPTTPTLSVALDGDILDTAEAVFAGPPDGISQQGLIRMWSSARGQQSKHILYVLSQRALLDMEDQELSVNRYPDGRVLQVIHGDLSLALPEGAVLYMTEANRIGVHVHDGINVVGMLRAFHRYATRMIRLDI
jgi:hypothetical protein